MLTVEEALRQTLEQAAPLSPFSSPLEAAGGLVLAEDCHSDLDSPPFDKALVDGYAVMAEDLSTGGAELVVLEEVLAGATPTQPLRRGAATRIMTGAPLPANADAVAMIEQSKPIAGDPSRVALEGRLTSGQNLMRRGQVMRAGERVLTHGTFLRPVEIGLLAELGRDPVCVYPRPQVAIASTGDELVAPGERPGPGQIRNSNGPLLQAAIQAAGATPHWLGVARDDLSSLEAILRAGLKHDVLILSGGVSAGVRDLVPGALAELGVRAIFHQVRLKPGKPLLFGVLPRADSLHAPPHLVFGLPGNPMSSLVCFELFVRPALRKLAGQAVANPPTVSAILKADFSHRGDRPTYYPARLRRIELGWTVETVNWQGSPDLRNVTQANALAVFPAGERRFSAGEPILALPFTAADAW